MDISKFQNKLRCTCNNDVIFEIINEIECDYGSHVVVQCLHCEELFTVDKKCSAFQNIFELLKNNPELLSEQEKSDYLLNSHLF